MSRMPLALTLCVAAASLPAAARAQSAADTGIYAVARGGVVAAPKQKFRNPDDVAATFDRTTKFKSSFTGEAGVGYDFGIFRLEQTIGYVSVKPKGIADDGFTGSGRTKAFNLAVSGFVDIPTGTIVTPYVGGGAGISRVDGRLERTSLAGVASSYSDKDYGLLWHVDAGVGFAVAPKVTVEVGGRYSQTGNLKFKGVSDGQDAVFKPKFRTVAGTLGVRYVF